VVADDTPNSPRVVLGPNYPNPFNPSTRFDFFIPDPGHVQIDVFDLYGRYVDNLTKKDYPSGWHQATWLGSDHEGRSVPSGVHFYRLKTEHHMVSRRMTLLR
jgi:flagellar hook assembly protein FlgD